MYRTAIAIVLVLALAAGLFAAADWRWDIVMLEAWIQEHAVLGAIVYIGVFIVSTVLPITSLPLLPLAARAYGVPLTFLLTMAGWWLGCLIAFEIARRARPYLVRLASPKMLSRCERAIARRHTFGTIVVLRIVFPGDFVGFALGLLRHVRFSTFAAASFIGTLPSAVIGSYAGGELGHGRYWSAVAACVAMIVAVMIVRRMWESRIEAQPACAVTEEKPSR